MKKLLVLFSLAALVTLTGCRTDADKASHNLSVAADNFEVSRRITFINGFTNDYMLTVEGKCSIKVASNNKLDVICKTGGNTYKKHFLGLSDNVTYISEQLDSVGVSEYHTRIIFKPENIIPDFEMKVGEY